MIEQPTLSEAFKTRTYVAMETPAMQKLVWAYRYWRQRNVTATRALLESRVDVANNKDCYPNSGAGYGSSGKPFKAFGESHMRWIESPTAAGLRFVGYADKIARLDHTGWFQDDDGADDTVRGVVFQMAGRDGKPRFVPGYQNPYNGAADKGGPVCLSFDEIFESDLDRGLDTVSHGNSDGARECAQRADRIAELMAESARDYRRANQAGFRFVELGDEIKEMRQDALALLEERRAAIWYAKKDGKEFPTICATIASEVHRIWRDIGKARKERAELFDQFGHVAAFNDV